MAANEALSNNAALRGKRLLDNLQNDLRCISNEAKKKHPPLKEVIYRFDSLDSLVYLFGRFTIVTLLQAAEAGIIKLRSSASKHSDLRLALISESPDILEPFFMACDTKVPKMVQISLTAIQRMITFEAISSVAAFNLINNLWSLMESGTEEVKLLQTITLLISTNNIVQSDALSKALALCFRLHFTKNQTTNNTASATIRQLVSVIFERVQKEDETEVSENNATFEIKYDELKIGSRIPPRSLRPSACDAFLLFQDLVQLVNADQPFWLVGLTEMTRTFGLELLELIFTSFPDIFFKHEEFSFLLKERVCPLLIKLFSPNIKYKPCPQQHLQQLQQLQQQQQQQHVNQTQNNLISSDKPFFPISMRLLRIVNVLIQKFYTLLITESEIFLSLLVKFLEPDKPSWQRALALEVIHKMCMQPNLIRSFCLFYDMKPHSSKIFRDIVNALGVYTQSVFISPPITPNLLSSLINAAAAATMAAPSTTASTSTSSTTNSNVISSNTPITPQPAFLYRGIWIPIVFNILPGQSKSFLLDQLDKLDPPTVPDGYGLTTAYNCLLEVVRSVKSIIDEDRASFNKDNSDRSSSTKQELERLKSFNNEKRNLHEALLASSWCGLVAAFSLLLDASTDENVTEIILKQMEDLVMLYGIYNLPMARDCMVAATCRVSLPAGYNLPILNFKLPSSSEVSTPTNITPSNSTATLNDSTLNHSRSSSADLSNASSSGNMNLLSSNAAILLSQQTGSKPNIYLGSPQSESSDFRQQVVAVGTALPCSQASSGLPQGPVMLTAKNLQCMKTILSFAHSHGSILMNSWHIVLTTLQHLVWILGLKPSAGGSLQTSRPGTEAGASTSSLITTAAMSDLPVLSALLSRLFESSQELDDGALLHLIDALIKLSQESMEIAYNNREPSLFAVAKLLETGIVNISRCDIIWKPLTSHLLDVCQHPHLKMREWGAEALTSLVKTALASPELTNKNENRRYMILASLQDLSSVSHPDIRQKQLDCTLQILQSSGDSLSDGWPQTLDIVGAINDSQNENLIRLAFQCLQLIVNDFLSNISPMCLVLVVDTTAKFGSQVKELNVSLTAIGLLWNIADFLFQNQEKIKQFLSEDEKTKKESEKNSSLLPAYDCLWMSLFSRLGDLCTDSRPSIRKSASQTLFSTLGTHGAVLEGKLWHAVLWQVLFPLLDRVRTFSTTASNDKITDVPKSMGITGIGNSGSILLHHSRNTAQKQWSETQVLTLSGVARVFSSKRDQLVSGLEDFEKAWIHLFGFIEASAMSKNPEVSLSALKCFQEVLCIPSTPSGEAAVKTNCESKLNIWTAAWKVWCNIGIECSKCTIEENNGNNTRQFNSTESFYIPSQTFLTSHVQIFPYLFQHLKVVFSPEDFSNLSTVLQNSVSVPLDVATQAFLMTATAASYQESGSQTVAHGFGHQQQAMLTPLQEAIFFVIETLQNEILTVIMSSQNSNIETLLPLICNQLLTFSTYACNPPVNVKICNAFNPGNTRFAQINVSFIVVIFRP
ncbi:protein MON2-like protein [Dinothrombium tinctorium]|uniref:Protein MON2-like protein n=1 Tax=Dinothrombium tinctorium TaxID=1965070 RepID=A0A443RMD4_9ACAR|nr:protein MON2-like protein [Dinothrombium tinctorium]